MNRYDEDWLECQGCSAPLYLLDPADKQAVAYNPERYIVFCRDCKLAEAHIEENFRWQ